MTGFAQPSRHGKLIRACTSLLVAHLVVSQTGCFTKMTLDRWQTAPLRSASLEVIEAHGDLVRLKWKATYRGAPTRSGKLELDPELPECEDVRVLIRDGNDVLNPTRETQTSPRTHSAPSKEMPPGACDVIIVVARATEDVALSASNASRRLGATAIKAPHNHVWLAIIPMAAVGDAAIVVALIPLVVFIGMAGSDHPTTWTWTP
jgi:hypothetical protein